MVLSVIDWLIDHFIFYDILNAVVALAVILLTNHFRLFTNEQVGITQDKSSSL